MSYYWENVTWQSSDGTWNVGFYERISGPSSFDDDDDEYDSEWDDDFTDNFGWVSSGHGSRKSAEKAWTGANPGGSTAISYDQTDPSVMREIEDLEDMAAKTRLAAVDPDFRMNYEKTPYYQGPEKHRKGKFIAKDLYEAKFEAYHYAYYDYVNLPDPRIKSWENQVDTLYSSGSESEKASIDKVRGRFKERCEDWMRNIRESNRGIAHLTKGRDKIRQNKVLKEMRDELASLNDSSDTRKSSMSNGEVSGNYTTPSNNTRTYHLTKSGQLRPCNASTLEKCPYGKKDGAKYHGDFSTKEEAVVWQEKTLEKKHGGTLSKGLSK